MDIFQFSSSVSLHPPLNRIFLKIDTDRVTLQGTKVADSLYNLKRSNQKHFYSSQDDQTNQGPCNCDKNKNEIENR